jgi:LEA14-like dessication related protein
MNLFAKKIVILYPLYVEGMKKFLLQGGLILSFFLLSSCVANLDRVRVESYGLKDVTFSGASRVQMNVSIKVYNPTGKKLTLQRAAFDVLDGDAVIARMRLLEAVDIPASSDGYHLLPVELNITDMLALLTGGIDLNNPQLDKLLVNGSLKVRAGLLSKTVAVHNKTIEQLLKEL